MIEESVAKQVKINTTHHDTQSKTIFGFWIYLMTDCILFATLFATYAVLRNSNYGGPTEQDIFSLPFVLTETLILLTSSFICGLALIATRNKNKKQALTFMGLTLALGIAFIGMEFYEFNHLFQSGEDWRRSGFLSAFFTLVGTHGLHILVGLVWGFALIGQIIKRGFTQGVVRRIALFSLFWHFLDIIWIFIFSIVYLLGVL